MLPTSLPVASGTLNYAGVAVGIVLLGACSVWVLPRIGARHWYRGELKNYREPEAVRSLLLWHPAAERPVQPASLPVLLVGCPSSLPVLIVGCPSPVDPSSRPHSSGIRGMPTHCNVPGQCGG